jgi:hypothetical protein
MRPEDGAWDVNSPNIFYFATTDKIDGTSQLLQLTFDDINKPEIGGAIKVVLNARDIGAQMFDNITVSGDGKVLALCSENPQFPQFGNLTLADSIVIKWSRLYGNAPPAPGECIDSINREYFESRDDDSRVVQTNRTLQRIAGEHGLPLLDKQDLICDERRGQCTGVLEDGRKAFWDAAHFTLDGARAFGRRAAEIGWLDPAVRAVDPVDR